MGNIVQSLKEYFQNTSKSQLDTDWKEIEPLNEVGPDALEYCKLLRHLRKHNSH